MGKMHYSGVKDERDANELIWAYLLVGKKCFINGIEVVCKILLQIAWDKQDTKYKKRGVKEHKQQQHLTQKLGLHQEW